MTSCRWSRPDSGNAAVGRPEPGTPGIRWTIGDVHPLGVEALRLSIWGAWKLFGPAAKYAVCANSVPLS